MAAILRALRDIGHLQLSSLKCMGGERECMGGDREWAGVEWDENSTQCVVRVGYDTGNC